MIKKVYSKIIRIYQIIISPLLGSNCRFYPSCSQYSLESVKKYGFLKGIFKTFKRIFKCHPFSKGGIDLP